MLEPAGTFSSFSAARSLPFFDDLDTGVSSSRGLVSAAERDGGRKRLEREGEGGGGGIRVGIKCLPFNLPAIGRTMDSGV